MSGFKDLVAADICKVFLDLNGFAELRTIIYDGETYQDIPIVLSGAKEQDRRKRVDDHAEGLFMVSAVLHCAAEDLGGKRPKKGSRIRINNEEGGGGFFRDYYVASAANEMGMLRVELEAIDQ